MATGNKKGNFKIDIQTKAAEDSIKSLQSKVSKLNSDLSKLDSTSSKYESTLKKLTTTQKQLNKEETQYSATLKQTTSAHKNSVTAVQQRINALRQEMNVMDMSSDKFKVASANMRQLTASMRAGSSATGLHAASAMELGRVFSDAPYGIRGVANNISQLSALMSQAATTTDAATGKAIGFSGAMKGLVKSLMGPLGILLAIQAAVAALEYFSTTAERTTSVLGELSQEGVTTVTTKLGLLVRATNDSTVALDQKQEMVRRANEEIEGLNASLDENGNLTQDSVANIQAMTTELMKVAKATAAVELIKDLNKELIKLQIEGLGFGDKALLAFKNFFTGNDIGKTWAEEQLAEIDRMKSVVEGKFDEIFDIGKDQEFLPHIFGEKDSSGGGSRGRALRNFKKMIFDLSKEILSMDRNIEMSQEKNVIKRLEVESKYAKEDLKLKQELFVKAQTKRVTDLEEKEKDNRKDLQREIKQTKAILEARKKAFKEMIKSGNADGESLDAASLSIQNDEAKLANQQSSFDKSFNLSSKARKKLSEMIIQSEQELGRALTKEEEEHLVEMGELKLKIQEEYDIASQKAILDRASAELDLMNELLDEKDPRSLAILQERQRALFEQEDIAFEEDVARKLIKLQEQGNSLDEAQFLIDEERRMNAIARNQEEVDMETAKIESIKAVRMEYIGWLSSIGSTMKKLSKDNEGLAKAAVIVEKSAATAKVIATTQAANQDIINTSTSAASESIAGGTASVAAGGIATAAGNPQGLAMSAAGKASIATGTGIGAAAKGKILKNNIGAGLAIANIWAESQGSSGDAGGGSGGSGGGGNSFNPSFNVVGNSETNQLAESIGGQVNTPTRAFVVYEDIENATELNANAVESSGI